jgi:hypothetical protein
VVDKVAFNAYRTTNYMAYNTGDAFIQQFIKMR